MDNKTNTDTLIEVLLQTQDELYQELSKLREIDNGALEKAEAVIKEKDIQLQEKDNKIKHLTDQLS
ncbi:hypothetical protein [Maribellus comscasis]|uniref:hypothetical protein n=1 Tax=Maribellus comscasis TaxID=2681766 RepID=UPI001FE83C23|nr:hypothetical protein [Maribellus comscasis]